MEVTDKGDKKMKTAIIVLSIILGIGIVFTGVGGIIYAVNPAAFSSSIKEELVAKTIDETALVTSLNFNTSSEEVEFKESPDNTLKVEYFESEHRKFEYSLVDGEATFKSIIQPWNIRDMFNFLSEDVIITVYVPVSVTSLDLDIASGDATWEHNQAMESLDINCASGNISIRNINVSGLVKCNTTSGNVNLNNLQVAGDMDLDSTSGEITVSDSSCSNINITLTSGDVNISTLAVVNDVVFSVISGNISSTGLSASSIKSETTSGNVELGLKGMPAEYSARLSVISGTVIITGQGASGLYTGSSNWGSGEKDIDIDVVSGNTTIRFEGN
jgi:DUF4097 and DUF4098 domain-containing protein YvlB